jgi:MFS family permease
MLSLVIMGFIVGGLVTWLGYYTPFIIFGAALFTIGCALTTTFTVDQADWRAYGLTIVAGLGCGASLQNAFMSVQAVLPQSTLPIGNASVMFSQTLAYVLTFEKINEVEPFSLLSHRMSFQMDSYLKSKNGSQV